MLPVVPGIQQVFTCFAAVHARLNVYLFNSIVCWIRQISMVTEAAKSRWMALEDALGPSCDKRMHLSCKLNCASGLFQGANTWFTGSAWNCLQLVVHLCMSWTKNNLKDQVVTAYRTLNVKIRFSEQESYSEGEQCFFVLLFCKN